jgi:hypothetical protein
MIILLSTRKVSLPLHSGTCISWNTNQGVDEVLGDSLSEYLEICLKEASEEGFEFERLGNNLINN